MRNRYIEPLSFDSAPACNDFPHPITPKVPVMRNSAIPMLATCCRPWIAKPMAKRTVQSECDPEHQDEEQESEHEALQECGGRPRLPHRLLVGSRYPRLA